MSKTPEEMAFEWWAEYSKDKDLNKWDTVDPTVGFVAGYQAAKKHAHAALEEAEAKIQELQDQLADADKVMPDTCEHILDMSKMMDVNGWISVKDRLPECGENYLVLKDDGISPYQLAIVWFDRTWDVSNADEITHWMPLPEPPKEEE
jgi:hypothetical protein